MPDYTIPVYRVKLVRETALAHDRPQGSRPEDFAAILHTYLPDDTDREHFVVMFLDSALRVIGIQTVHIGAMTHSLAEPREVFKAALLVNASSVLLCHNHPGGDPTPSRADCTATRRMVDAGTLLDIHVIDHIILGAYRTFASMKERGLM